MILSQTDIDIIRGWYLAAAGESASGLTIPPREEMLAGYEHRYDETVAEAKEVLALLRKLGIEPCDSDAFDLRREGLLP